MPRNSKSDRSNEHAHYPTLEVVPNTTAASCAVGLSAFLLREWLLADKRSRAQQEIRILVSCRGSVPSLSLVTWSLFCRARLADIAGSCLPSARKDVTARGCWYRTGSFLGLWTHRASSCPARPGRALCACRSCSLHEDCCPKP